MDRHVDHKDRERKTDDRDIGNDGRGRFQRRSFNFHRCRAPGAATLTIAVSGSAFGSASSTKRRLEPVPNFVNCKVGIAQWPIGAVRFTVRPPGTPKGPKVGACMALVGASPK